MMALLVGRAVDRRLEGDCRWGLLEGASLTAGAALRRSRYHRFAAGASAAGRPCSTHRPRLAAVVPAARAESRHSPSHSVKAALCWQPPTLAGSSSLGCTPPTQGIATNCSKRRRGPATLALLPPYGRLTQLSKLQRSTRLRAAPLGARLRGARVVESSPRRRLQHLRLRRETEAQ